MKEGNRHRSTGKCAMPRVSGHRASRFCSNGVFLHLNGKKHKKGDYLSICQDNTILPPGIDEVAIYGSTEGVQNGNYSGTLTWPIAQLYRQVKSKDKGVDYTTLTCNTVSDQSGITTTSKGGATKTFRRNDPTTP